MEFNFIYLIGIVVLAIAAKNYDKIRKRFLIFHYAFWSELLGVLSMISCHDNKKDNKIKKYPDRKGYVAVVTGGGRGMGPYLIRELTKCGMHVVIGMRNPTASEELDKLMEEEKTPGSIELMELDLSKMKSVKKFADNVKAKFPEIHLLVCNAGIIYKEFELTEDNFESHMATNYYGHFYLTHLLMDNLLLFGVNKPIYSRVVNVSSSAHWCCGINFNDINWKLEYYTRAAYGQSKSAQLMMTKYLNRQFETNLDPVRMYAVHPGVVNTQMVDMYKEKSHLSWFLNKYLKSPLEGAISIAYACIDEGLEGRGGHYLSNCADGWATKYSDNKSYQKRLYRMTCEALNIKKFGPASK